MRLRHQPLSGGCRGTPTDNVVVVVESRDWERPVGLDLRCFFLSRRQSRPFPIHAHWRLPVACPSPQGYYHRRRRCHDELGGGSPAYHEALALLMAYMQEHQEALPRGVAG